ncbi:MAG: hypothetical protein H6R21_1657 [Proteobacteria bacterium]|nr:hypothetical protein [Pseudomonadota bacterium]
MNDRRKFLTLMVAVAMTGTAIAAEPTLATVYLNPT